MHAYPRYRILYLSSKVQKKYVRGPRSADHRSTTVDCGINRDAAWAPKGQHQQGQEEERWLGKWAETGQQGGRNWGQGKRKRRAVCAPPVADKNDRPPLTAATVPKADLRGAIEVLILRKSHDPETLRKDCDDAAGSIAPVFSYGKKTVLKVFEAVSSCHETTLNNPP
eukprot:SAG11_NODE_2388_length_3416_cov_2.842327_1_plen_168_part_00